MLIYEHSVNTLTPSPSDNMVLKVCGPGTLSFYLGTHFSFGCHYFSRDERVNIFQVSEDWRMEPGPIGGEMRGKKQLTTVCKTFKIADV